MSRAGTEQELGPWGARSQLSPGPGRVPGCWTSICWWLNNTVCPLKVTLARRMALLTPACLILQISSCTLWEIQLRSHICTRLWISQGNWLQYR